MIVLVSAFALSVIPIIIPSIITRHNTQCDLLFTILRFLLSYSRLLWPPHNQFSNYKKPPNMAGPNNPVRSDGYPSRLYFLRTQKTPVILCFEVLCKYKICPHGCQPFSLNYLGLDYAKFYIKNKNHCKSFKAIHLCQFFALEYSYYIIVFLFCLSFYPV